MYIAMNRFQISLGSEKVFEDLWRSRDSQLAQVPGFREFQLLKGPEAEDHVLYASHTVWDSEQAFRDWTQSESFVKVHRQATAPKGTYLGHPRFEGFEVTL